MKRLILIVVALLLVGCGAYAVELDEDGNGAVDIARGGTNATTAEGARTALNVITGLVPYSGAVDTVRLGAWGIEGSSGNFSAVVYTPLLRLDAGDAINDTCSSGTRGAMKIIRGGTGVADILKVCMKGADDSYAWQTL